MAAPSTPAPDRAPSGAPRPGGPATLAGHTVSRIGYGAMQLARLRGDTNAAAAVLRRAWELGVDHIDTAQFYGDGFVNTVIGQTFGPEDKVVIISKVGAETHPGGDRPLRPAQRPEQLRASVEDNLATLRLDRIPVVNLRRLDVGPGLRASGDQLVDLDDQLAALIALREEGKIGAIGLSSVTFDTLNRALPAGIACVQNAYSLLMRSDEDMLALCGAENIAWIPYFPLGSAFEGIPKVTEAPAVTATARSLGCTPAQIGLAWLLRHAPNTLLIPGTANTAHLQANIATAQITLDDATLAQLDAIAAGPQD
ncbi:MAG: aldo/keto reductase [Nocardia sp.]|nr:aldo/keto reductase [Nocardia sp.]